MGSEKHRCRVVVRENGCVSGVQIRYLPTWSDLTWRSQEGKKCSCSILYHIIYELFLCLKYSPNHHEEIKTTWSWQGGTGEGRVRASHTYLWLYSENNHPFRPESVRFINPVQLLITLNKNIGLLLWKINNHLIVICN